MALLLRTGLIAPVMLLAACGGGGGNVGSTPRPSPVPTPTPTPAPAPTPTPPPPDTNFDTAEFRRSDGPDFHDAVAAWSDGITGRDATIAIIDTGIDTDNPEFAGRINPASRDVAGNDTVEAVDDHGTNIALVAAAARDDTGIVGIAYEADILAIRTDRPGSCDADSDEVLDGCVFFDSDIARGIDIAIANGARVINLSLGGSSPSSSLRAAVGRAAAAGLVIVVSAGNDGDGTNPDIDPDQPDPFPQGIADVAGDNLIIVGSVDDNGVISDFSNRAGNLASVFLTARGERICCVYENGELLVTEENGQRFVTLFSGTSFSAPQVAGAVALLAQAFPNLTGTEIVSLLLDTARDAGATGVDSVYGTGILDIGAALSPQGTTAIAGTERALAHGDLTGVTSAAMGDALANGSLSTIVTDSYDRPYAIDLAAGGRRASLQPRLRNVIEQRTDILGGSDGTMSLAVTIDQRNFQFGSSLLEPLEIATEDAERSQILAATVALRVSPDMQLGFGMARSGDTLIAQLQGHSRPAFLMAKGGSDDSGFTAKSDAAVALRRKVGDWGFTVSAEDGEVRFEEGRALPGAWDPFDGRYGMSRFSLAADRRWSNVQASIGATWLSEEATVLGAKFADAFGGRGSDTLFLDAEAAFVASGDVRLGAAFRQGFTRAQSGGLVADGSRMESRAWSLDATKYGLFQNSDSIGFRLSQPLRVESGGMMLDVPVSFDFATETATYGLRNLSLAPSGRELTGEIAWNGWLFGGAANASLFYSKEPGHIKELGEDYGLAIQWRKDF